MRIEGKMKRTLFKEEHLDRLMESSRLLGIDPIFDRRQVSDKLDSFLEFSKSSTPFLTRVCLFEDSLGICSRPVQPEAAELNGEIMRHKRSTPEAKSTSDKELYGRLAKSNLERNEFILVDPKEERVLESATSNLIFAKGQELVIPENEILTGIVLSKILNDLEKQFRIERRSPELKEIDYFEEIILCGTGREITSLARIPQAKWKRRKFKAFERIKETYNEIKLRNY